MPLYFARRNPDNLFFSEDDCPRTLYSFTNYGWSSRLLEKTWQLVVFVSNKFVSSCGVICLVIAREIFLLQSDCAAITKVHNFSLLSLLTCFVTCFVKDKQTLKTLYINCIFPDTDQFVVFFQLNVSLYGRLFNDPGSNYLRNIFIFLLL